MQDNQSETTNLFLQCMDFVYKVLSLRLDFLKFKKHSQFPSRNFVSPKLALFPGPPFCNSERGLFGSPIFNYPAFYQYPRFLKLVFWG